MSPHIQRSLATSFPSAQVGQAYGTSFFLDILVLLTLRPPFRFDRDDNYSGNGFLGSTSLAPRKCARVPLCILLRLTNFDQVLASCFQESKAGYIKLMAGWLNVVSEVSYS